MNNRLKLHDLLLTFECPNVYYQAPSNNLMKYPCIKYEKTRIDNVHANNKIYRQDNKYTITVISKKPDDELADKISQIPHISFDRIFISDNLYHTVFNLYF